MAKQAANSPTFAAEIFMPVQEKKSCILADIMINLFFICRFGVSAHILFQTEY